MKSRISPVKRPRISSLVPRAARSAYLFVACLGIWLPRVEAATLINLDAATHPPGPLNTWTNTGTVAGDFVVPFTATETPVNLLVDGVRGISFTNVTGAGGGAQGSHFEGPIAPASICGANPRTIEAWILNPTSQSDEVVFAWGRRGEDGLNNAFGHGESTAFGAVTMWGAPDLSWGNTASQVATNRVLNRWTYIVQTFDGQTNSVYVDGRLANREGPPATLLINTTNLDTFLNPIPFRVARQITADGTISDAGDGSLIIGRIRVRDVPLSAVAISNQFYIEKDDFNLNDVDGDGMPGWWEARHGLNPNSGADAFADPDFDGLTNLEEFSSGTIPTEADTDNDGLYDGAEVNRIDPQTTLPAPTNPLKYDTDDDGLSDSVETDTGIYVSPANTGSDPLRGDSDGDIWSDGMELIRGTDPNATDGIPPIGIVELDAGGLAPAPLNLWVNSGTLGGNFVVPTNATVPSVSTVDGAKGVAFLSSGGIVGGTHYLGPEVPASVTGAGPRTIVAWIQNPNPPSHDEVVFSWGRFAGNAPEGKNYSLSHGTNDNWGALVAWGASDLGWADAEVYGIWSQIAATYDGITNRVYINGTLINSEVAVLNTSAFAAVAPDSAVDSTNRLHFRIARSNTDTGGPGGGPNGFGAFTLGKVSVFDVTLDVATIRALFEARKGSFNLNDTDGDGMPDWYEIRWGLDRNNPMGNHGATGNPDNDGLTNIQEFQLGTAATDADSDDDGANDGPELFRVDPQTSFAAPTDPLNPDTDGDGLRDGVETDTGIFVSLNNTGSDPLQWDSDGDTFSDGLEVELGSDPNGGEFYVWPWVALTANLLPEGPLQVWTNLIAPGAGDFWAPSGTIPTFVPFVAKVDGINAVHFTPGPDCHYLGPDVNNFLTGAIPRTVEAWVYNDTPQDQEVIVAWGRRGGFDPDGKNFAFGHGQNDAFGAIATTSDGVGWANREIYGQWTYLVATYDGTVARSFVNGVEVTNRTVALNTAAFAAIAPNSPTNSVNRLRYRIGRQNSDVGNTDASGAGFFALARLRVWSLAHSPDSVSARFLSERQQFAAPLRFRTVTNAPNGAITLSWSGGLPGQPVFIQTSSNLLHWTTVATNLNGNTHIDSPTQPVPQKKFYRLKNQ